MAASEKQIVTWKDFRGGEAGTRHGLESAPANSFTGRNVVVYRDGAVGPRCGLFEITPTGQSNGKIHAMGATGVVGNEMWYAQGTAVYQFGAARSSAYTGALASSPSVPSAIYDNVYLLVSGDKAYRLNHVAATVTALTGSPGGRCIAAFGTRVFIGGGSAQRNRVYYSADADDTDWTITAAVGAPGQFDVGSNNINDEIRGLYSFRDFLLIVKASGELWVLTTNGDPTTTGTLRKVAPRESGGGIFQQARGRIIYGNEYWAIGMDSTAPNFYTGGRLRSLPWLGTEVVDGAVTEVGPWASTMLQTDVLPPEYGITGLSQDSLLAVGSTGKGLLRRDGIWTKHEYGISVVGYIDDATFGAAFLTDGGGASAVPRFFYMNTANDRPPIKGAGIKLRDSVGDASDTAPACDFILPVWRDAQGRRVQVKHVIVTFRKYDTDVSATNHFDIVVRGEYGYENSGDSVSATQSFDEANSSGTAAGTRVHRQFGFGDQTYCESFQIEFTNLRGVSIDKVVAYLNTEPPLT